MKRGDGRLAIAIISQKRGKGKHTGYERGGESLANGIQARKVDAM